MSKKSKLSWQDRTIVGTVKLTTPNGSKVIQVRHGITDEGADSYVGRIDSGNGEFRPIPAFRTNAAMTEWTLTGDDGVPRPFLTDAVKMRVKTDSGENVTTRTDLDRTFSQVTIGHGDRLVSVKLEWVQQDNSDRDFVARFSGRVLTNGQRGAVKAPRLDAEDF